MKPRKRGKRKKRKNQEQIFKERIFTIFKGNVGKWSSRPRIIISLDALFEILNTFSQWFSLNLFFWHATRETVHLFLHPPISAKQQPCFFSSFFSSFCFLFLGSEKTLNSKWWPSYWHKFTLFLVNITWIRIGIFRIKWRKKKVIMKESF